jgi:hypothetical protein
MLCTNVFYSKRLTKYYPDYLVHNVLNRLLKSVGLIAL